MELEVQPWPEAQPPSEQALRAQLAAEGLRGTVWSSGPGDVYAAHSHSYRKVICVLRGSITFGLPEKGRRFELKAGDRLDLPAGVRHAAHVGPQGVACFEAHR
jgi:quercetin dioxygenase-like cupin family protein